MKGEAMKKIIIIFLATIIMISSITVLAQSYPNKRDFFRGLAVTSMTSNSVSHNSRFIQEMCYAYDSTCRTKMGGYSGIDGVFGSDTQEAVKYFQLDNAVYNDGSVGANTWGKLYDHLKPISMTSSSQSMFINYACLNSAGVQQGWQTISGLRFASESTSGDRIQLQLYGTWRTLS